jgi:LuxR family maltose regulon positive regulatory protein
MRREIAFITKILVPRRRPDTVRRERMLEKVRSASGGQLTILRAPAGYGKTTLLVDLAREVAGGVCWVSLDEWDRDAATFLQYLRLSVEQTFASAGARRGPARPVREPRSLLGELTTQIADHDDETWIFLDDFHCVDGSEEVLDLIDYFAQRMPSNSHVFLSSRTVPALPSLARLRLEGRTLELDPRELAFTADEIKQYYRSTRGQDLLEDQADRILKFTQGWPASVALFSDPDTAGGGDQATSVPLSDYLVAEILDRLPQGLRRFLLRTSILDTLEASGCEAVLHKQGSARLLETLERQNVPLMRIQGPVAEYRVHPLLRDFLRNKLRLESPERYRKVNREAGAWQASRGRASEAIWHFGEAEEWDEAAALILKEAPGAYGLGRWHTVASWLEIMPRTELRGRPELRLWEARILVRLGQADEALRVVSEAVDSLKDGDPITLAQLETMRATALRVKGDTGWALASCQRAVNLAARGNAPVDILAEARKQLGHVLFGMGSFSEAAREFRGVLDIYEQRGDIEEMAFVNGCLGSALGSLGKLADSATHLEQARQQWRKVGNVKELAWVLNNLAMTYYQMGQPTLARELFLDALSKATEGGHHQYAAYILVSLADIDRQSRDFFTALQRYEEALALAGDLGDAMLSTHALTGLAHSFREVGDLNKGEVLARQALVSACERDSPYEQGLAQMALGRLWRKRGKLEDAASTLSAAVALFDRVNANKELAEALFYLADSSLSVRRGRSLLRITLERLAVIANELGHDYFLVQATRETPAVAEYGASRRIAGGFYRDLLRRSAPQRLWENRPVGDHAAMAERLPAVEVKALGDLQVLMEGREILNLEWESEKSKELLLLLLTHERPLRRDEIVTALWPEAGASRAISAFHSNLYRVRRALYTECVIESGGTYTLNPAGAFRYDVREFERAVETARRMAEDAPGYVDTLRRATDLYRGPFAPGFEGEWVNARRLKLEQAFLEIGAKLADWFLRRGDHAGAVHTCQRLLEYDPYNEAACYKLMKAHQASGDHEASLYAFRRYSEVLEMDIGERPGLAIVELYSDIRNRLGRTAGRPP